MSNETDWFPAHIKPVHEGVAFPERIRSKK